MYRIIKNIAHQAFLYGIGSALTRLTGFILIPVYARYINPAEFGILAIFLLVMSILQILYGMGIHAAFLRFYYDCKTGLQKRKLMGTVIIFLLLMSIIFSFILLLNQRWILKVIFDTEQYEYHFSILILNIVFELFFLSFLELLRAKEMPLKYIIFSVNKFILSLLLNILFIIYYKRGFLGVLEGGMLASLVSLIFIYFNQMKSVKVSLNYSTLKEMMKYGLPFVPANLCSLILTSSDRYLLKMFSSYSEVGLYSMGYKFGLIINIFLIMPFNLAWPTQIINISKKENAKEIFAKVMTYVILIATLCSVSLIVFIQDIYKIVLTPEYFASYSIVQFIAFSYVFQGIYCVGILGMFIRKKTKPQLVIFSIAAILNLVLNFIFIPRWGMHGAAIATFLSYLVIPILTYYYSQKLYKVEYEYIRIVKIFFSAVVVISLNHFANDIVFLTSFYGKFLLILLFSAILTLTGFFDEKEIKKFSLIFHRMD